MLPGKEITTEQMRFFFPIVHPLLFGYNQSGDKWTDGRTESPGQKNDFCFTKGVAGYGLI